MALNTNGRVIVTMYTISSKPHSVIPLICFDRDSAVFMFHDALLEYDTLDRSDYDKIKLEQERRGDRHGLTL
jgi:hypothetical protein